MTEEPERRQGNRNWYVLTAGLPPIDTAVTLAPGVSLRPLESPLSVFDLAAAGAAGFRPWASLELFAPACTAEIESAWDSSVVPGYDTLNRAWLASALLVLRGFTRHLCIACSSYPWNRIAGHQPRTAEVFQQQAREEGIEAAVFRSKRELPPIEGDILDLHHKMVLNSQPRTNEITDTDGKWTRDHFSAFNRLATDSERFRFALEAAIDWRYSTDARAAVARLWAGIEAVFGISSELVYRISLLSASLLSPRGQSRQDKFDEVKALYSLRSKVVHGGKLSESKIQEAIDGSFELLRGLLLLAIDRGHMLNDTDFDGALFY